VINNVHIPEQLDQLSKSDLLEFAQIVHEENVKLNAELKRESMELRSRLGGSLGRNSEYNAAIENMQQKLAKANERVRELEGLGSSLAYSEETGFIDLNKFAIENQIEGAQYVIDALSSRGMMDSLSGFIINAAVEQLRKEQEND